MKRFLKLILCAALFASSLAMPLISFAQTAMKLEKGDVIFYLTRHGKTMLNTTDRVQGWADAPLTPAGVEVAEQLGRGLTAKKVKFVKAVSSDSGRSVETMQIVLSKMGLPKMVRNTDWRLREFNFGTNEGELNPTFWAAIAHLEGKTTEEWMKTMTPKSFADGSAKLDEGKVKPGVNWPAENYEAITARVTASLDELAKEVSKKGGGNVLIVSHGLTILSALDILGANLFTGKPIRNASISQLLYRNGKYSILSVDDMSFVEAGK